MNKAIKCRMNILFFLTSRQLKILLPGRAPLTTIYNHIVTLQYIRKLLSSDQDILAAGNAAVEIVAGVLQTDGLRNPALNIKYVDHDRPSPTLRSVSRSHWKRHMSACPSTGLRAQQPGPFSPLTFLCWGSMAG